MADQNTNPTWGSNFKLSDPTTYLPTFGKWCGPGWSAGAQSSAPQLTQAQKDVGVTEVNGRPSPVDAACKRHDLAYSDAYGQPNQSALILQADVNLEKDLSKMDWSSLSAGEKTYAALMGAAFMVKINTVDIVGAVVEGFKADARAANAAIVNGGNDAAGKSFTDTNGNQVSCGRDPNGNLIMSCSKTLDTGAKVEGTFNTVTRASTVKTTDTNAKVTIDKDTTGDGNIDSKEVITKDASNKTTDDIKSYDAFGSPIYETLTVTSADKKTIETKIDSNGDSKWDSIALGFDWDGNGTIDKTINSGTTQGGMLDADKQLQSLKNSGQLDNAFWQDYSTWSTSQLVNGGIVTPPVTGGGTGTVLDTSPIGAFFESKTAATDPALSIARKTFKVLDASGKGMTAVQLAALDTNRDGKLSGAELNGLQAWSDLNEDGTLNSTTVAATNELTTLAAALSAAGLSSLRSTDYGFYTSGNSAYRTAAQASATAPANTLVAPTAQPSNYAALRNSDNRYILWANQYGASWIDWQPGHIKINQSTPNSLIGTDGNDSMDADHYAAYLGGLSGYFNLNLLTNFYAGAGDDVFGGSSRNDNVWGGTGNDTLFGYAGDDKLYGEEGNDQIQGGVGNDLLDGGIGNDRLFGEVGNDTLIGGDGDDIMLGFTASNDAKQTLLAGETDNDTMFGGAGNDQMYGGLGNDIMDGGDGNDLVDGGVGDDTLYGQAGDDELNAGAGNDNLDGGTGNDKMFGGVGNDTMYGGEGDDIMLGFTASNDSKQTLAAGETDNDLMYGGAGNDLMIGGLGDDTLDGGTGNDELQGGVGNDQLYGGDGNDRLFAGAGNDTVYGGAGDDLIFGGVVGGEAALAAGETDNNFLYGGDGNDTIVGGVGNDYIDGGAGADYMQGGTGDDIYIVNSVNDSILEYQNEGYDTVISNTNYILNTGIEELRLVEGAGAINGTGNALDNKIIGNSDDNILDGVTGADTMIGGLGNDTYYVDNVGDQVIELAGEGIDTVDSSISYTLGANVENLTLLDFSKAEKGLADGKSILVYGYPKAFELDYMQGNAVAGYKGTCALTAIANLGTQANQALTEQQVVQRAIDNKWAVTDPTTTDYQRGGSNYIGQQALLTSYGIRIGIVMGYNEQGIANLIKGGRGVIIGVNAGALWGDQNYANTVGNTAGGVNHVVTVTGVACDATTGTITGFYIADSGRGKVSDMTRYIPIEDFRKDANVANAYAIYTVDPIKLWEENINATGNDLDNVLTGNRGNNILTGGKGNDTLIGGNGNDTYQFAKGDGQDTIIENDATVGNMDTLTLSGINQNNLWLKHVGTSLQISVMGTNDQIIIKDWYLTGASGTDNQIERIKTADGMTLYNTDVERLVQSMASFAPPTAAQTNWTSGQRAANGAVLLAVTH